MDVQPITPAERVHCAYCAKPLQPGYSCRKTFYSGTVEAQGRTPEQQLSAYSTNRRVVRIARSYHTTHDDSGNPTARTVSSIQITHFPQEPREWGFWGVFCGQLCAARFGYASHKVGFRIPRK